jgi:hypothetical protein
MSHVLIRDLNSGVILESSRDHTLFRNEDNETEECFFSSETWPPLSEEQIQEISEIEEARALFNKRLRGEE